MKRYPARVRHRVHHPEIDLTGPTSAVGVWALDDVVISTRQFSTVAIGDTPPERIVCYCGSGVTACHLLLAMEACGLGVGRLYVGSWSEWCRTRPDAISPR